MDDWGLHPRRYDVKDVKMVEMFADIPATIAAMLPKLFAPKRLFLRLMYVS